MLMSQRLGRSRARAGVMVLVGLAAAFGVGARPSEAQCGPQFIRNSTFTSANGTVSALIEFQGDLIAGGAFSQIGGVSAARVARWNGVSWQAMGAGLGTAPSTTASDILLTVANGELYAAGEFTTAQGAPANAIVRWNGSAWVALPNTSISGGISAMTTYNNRVHVSGPSTSLRQWSGSAWNLIDSFNAPFVSGINASYLGTYGNALIVAGSQVNFSGTPHYIARWVQGGTSQTWLGTWSPLGSGIVSTGVTNPVEGFVQYNSELIVSGLGIASAGGVANTAAIARWNGTTWSSVGSGATNGFLAPPFAYAGDWYITGSATQFVGFSASFIARHGASGFVITPGLSLNSVAFAMLPFRGELVMGGQFTTAGGFSSSRLARWTTALTPWVALQPAPVTTPATLPASFSATIAAGYTATSAAWELETAPGSGVYVALSAGTIPGTTSTAAVGPLATGAFPLAITNTDELLNGRRVRAVFQTACGPATSNAALLTVTAAPTTGACCTGTACAIVTPAGCAGAFKGLGSTCEAPSNPITCCRANVNAVGGLTVQDIFDFLAAYFAGNASADFNQVGGLTVQDIFDFLSAYFAGC